MLLSHSHLRLNSLILCIPFQRWGSWDQAKRFSWYQQNLQRSDKELIPKLNEDLKEAEDLIFQDENTWRSWDGLWWFEIMGLLKRIVSERSTRLDLSVPFVSATLWHMYILIHIYTHADVVSLPKTIYCLTLWKKRLFSHFQSTNRIGLWTCSFAESGLRKTTEIEREITGTLFYSDSPSPRQMHATFHMWMISLAR